MKLALATLVLCSAAAAGETQHLAKVTNVVVLKRGAVESPDAKHCLGFSLKASEARRFLVEASIITPEQRHYEFLWSPCYVEGKALVRGEPVTWKIEALGVAVVTYADGSEVLLGDDRQRDKNGQ